MVLMTPAPPPPDLSEHYHGPNVTEADYCPVCVEKRVAPQLALHAGRGPWGSNDGSVRGVLEAWSVPPSAFIESLNAWGYRIALLSDTEASRDE